MTNLFRVAIPSKGRLRDDTVALLRDAGLRFDTPPRALSVKVRNAEIELLFVRADDIAELVTTGTAELGITGQDLLAEFGAPTRTLTELRFGYCRLMAAVPKSSPVTFVTELAGLRIATAHPKATSDYFAANGIDASVIALRGSVEVAPKLGVADAIVDLVSTGSTLTVNGLRTVGTILESQSVLFTSIETEATRNPLLTQFATALQSVTDARTKRYLLLNAPRSTVGDIVEIIPGLGSPTVVPVTDSDWCAIHSVVDADAVWSLLPLLKDAGATDILVTRIQQMVA
jgi:ATP phosphoribosyltransferase